MFQWIASQLVEEDKEVLADLRTMREMVKIGQQHRPDDPADWRLPLNQRRWKNAIVKYSGVGRG